MDEEDVEGGDEEEKLPEEPLSQLIERLDATVFGLVEALDADRSDLPRLLDEALKGSLWARQITREGEDAKELHRMILDARANLIWTSTTPQARRGHFAMGVGLEAGLSIDAMAHDLETLIDRADAAALVGEEEDLAEALSGLAERVLIMRPFIPDKNNSLPANWRIVLRQWVSGMEVEQIGPHNMRVVEDAFMYRLVWALEAIRTRRASLGWSPDAIAGGAAATLETGVPQLTMSMLIRAGLPSRRAAIAAVKSSDAVFTTPVEMREWLASNEIAAFTDQGDWPTPETAALWKRFRTGALSGGIHKWTIGSWKRLLDIPGGSKPLPEGLYRILPNDKDSRTWLFTADYQPIAPFKKPVPDIKPSLLSGRLSGKTLVVDAVRLGRGKVNWPRAGQD